MGTQRSLLSSTFLTLMILLFAGTVYADSKAPKGHLVKPVSANFKRLSSLVGSWKGEKKMTPDSKEMAEIRVEYALTAGGSALVEWLFKGTPHEMISVYHDDGDAIAMTHYCGLGNQPTMSTSDVGKDEVTFTFVDGSNMKSPEEHHMHSVTIGFLDDDRISHKWTSVKDGKEDHVEAFVLSRIE